MFEMVRFAVLVPVKPLLSERSTLSFLHWYFIFIPESELTDAYALSMTELFGGALLDGLCGWTLKETAHGVLSSAFPDRMGAVVTLGVKPGKRKKPAPRGGRWFKPKRD